MTQDPLDPGRAGRPADPLAAALLPVLMHRMNNTTQLLSSLSSLARCAGGLGWMERRSGDLAKASDLVDDLGYVLAVLASACGADLLLTRRVPRGVAIVVEVVRDTLRREGRSLAEPPGSLPHQAPDVAGGWELPWAIGALLWNAGRDLERGESLRWELSRTEDGWALCGDRLPRDAFSDLAVLLEQRLPEAALEVTDRGWRWRMPARWLRD